MSVMSTGSAMRSSESAEWETPQRVFDQLNRARKVLTYARAAGPDFHLLRGGTVTDSATCS